MAESIASQTIDQALQAYGFDGARDIFGELLDSVGFANKWVAPEEPVSGLQIFIDTNHAVYPDNSVPVVGLHTDWDVLGIGLNGAATAEELLPYIRSTVVHETVHVAQWQYGVNHRGFSAETQQDWSLFDLVVNEGVAVLAEEAVVGVEQVARDYRLIDDEALVINLLAALLRSKHENIPFIAEDYYGYMFGDDDFPHKGYVVGRYAAKLMIQYGYSLEELVRAPFDEFYKVIRSSL